MENNIGQVLDKIRAELHSLCVLLQEQIDSIRTASEAQRDAQGKIQAAISEGRVPENDRKEENSYRKRNYAVQVILATGTLGAFVSAAIYAGIAAHQLTEMKKATKATEQSAYAACISAQISRSSLLELQSGTIDSHNLAVGSIIQADAVTRAEAAVLRVDRDIANPEYGLYRDSNESIIILSYEIRNVGQSIALDFHAKAMAKIMKVGEEPRFSEAFPAFNNLASGSTFPDRGVKTEAKPWQIFISDDKGERMGPGDPEFMRFQKPNGDGVYLSIYGRVTYQDAFGISHWTQFCYHLPWPYKTETKYRFPKCAAYNKTDVNSVPERIPNKKTPAPPETKEIACSVPEGDD